MIPTVKPNTFTTTEDNGHYISTAVYIGEETQISDYQFLRELKFCSIEKQPRGVVKTYTTYKIDIATMLKVSCEEKIDKTNRNLVGEVKVKVGSFVC